jgi:hypothetical protein
MDWLTEIEEISSGYWWGTGIHYRGRKLREVMRMVAKVGMDIGPESLRSQVSGDGFGEAL